MMSSKIQKTVLNELRSLQSIGEEDIIKKIVKLFLNTSKERILSLDTSLKKMDLTTLKNEAHALKSSSYRVGAYDLAKSCQNLEDTLNGFPEQKELIASILKLKKEWNAATEELRDIIKDEQAQSEPPRA